MRRYRFDELRELCRRRRGQGVTGHRHGRAGFRALIVHGRFREASQLGSELMALLESIGDPTLTVGLLYAPLTAKFQTGELAEVLRLAQTHDRPGRRRPRQGQPHHRITVGRRDRRCGGPPGFAWAIRDGGMTSSSPQR